jgi:hypothetical protein
VSGAQGASDLGRGLPDHLRVVTNHFSASTKNTGKLRSHKESAFVSPSLGHTSVIENTGGTTPEVLSLASASAVRQRKAQRGREMTSPWAGIIREGR